MYESEQRCMALKWLNKKKKREKKPAISNCSKRDATSLPQEGPFQRSPKTPRKVHGNCRRSRVCSDKIQFDNALLDFVSVYIGGVCQFERFPRIWRDSSARQSSKRARQFSGNWRDVWHPGAVFPPLLTFLHHPSAPVCNFFLRTGAAYACVCTWRDEKRSCFFFFRVEPTRRRFLLRLLAYLRDTRFTGSFHGFNCTCSRVLQSIEAGHSLF